MTPSPVDKPNPRVGMIGCGGMGRSHAKRLVGLGVPVTACVDVVPDAARRVADEVGCRTFDDPDALLDSGLVDAVVISTPHFSHPPLSIAAFEHGLHVFVEKPVAVTAADAKRMNDAHAKVAGRVVFAVDFNQRMRPVWQTVKRMCDDGTLGPVHRVAWTITDWYRPNAYYASGGWRGTWRGEGGGVLVNQCPHQLDLLCWFVGLPTRVMASVRLGKHHPIEVEDEVHALLEWENGATGTFVTSTGEATGVNRLEIVGDRATLRITDSKSIELIKPEVPTGEHVRTAPGVFDKPAVSRGPVEVGTVESDHTAALANFVAAIRGEGELLIPGIEGIRSVELANAMLFSGLRGVPVDLPADPAAFEALLGELQAKA